MSNAENNPMRCCVDTDDGVAIVLDVAAAVALAAVAVALAAADDAVVVAADDADDVTAAGVLVFVGVEPNNAATVGIVTVAAHP